MENEFTLWKALENLKNFPRVSIGMETLNLSFRDNLQNPFSLFHRVFPGLSVGFSPVSIGMENFPKGCRSVGSPGVTQGLRGANPASGHGWVVMGRAAAVTTVGTGLGVLRSRGGAASHGTR